MAVFLLLVSEYDSFSFSFFFKRKKKSTSENSLNTEKCQLAICAQLSCQKM